MVVVERIRNWNIELEWDKVNSEPKNTEKIDAQGPKSDGKSGKMRIGCQGEGV